MGVAFWYIATIVFLMPSIYQQIPNLKEGDEVRSDIVTPILLEVEDPEATAHARQQLIHNRLSIWVRDSEVESSALHRLNSFFDLMARRNPKNPEEIQSLCHELIDQLDLAMDTASAAMLRPSRLETYSPPLALSEVSRDLGLVVSHVLNQRNIVSDIVLFQAAAGSQRLEMFNTRGLEEPVPDVDQVLQWPQDVRDFLTNHADGLLAYFPGRELEPLRQACADLLVRVLGPNIRYDREQSDQLYEDRLAELQTDPRTKVYEPGQLIAKKGDKLHPVQVSALEALNSLHRKTRAVKFMGIVLMTAVIFLVVIVFLSRFQRKNDFSTASVSLHVLPPLMAIAIAQGLTVFDDPLVVMHAFPAALVGILSTLLISPQVALLLIISCAALYGMVTGQSLDFLILALLGGFCAVVAGRNIQRRGQMLMVGIKVALVNTLAVFVLTFLHSQWHPSWAYMLIAALNGISCALVSFVLLWAFEQSFGIVTDLRLLELSGIRNELLSQLEEKAPGSYQHVLNVTKLAEAAAHSIGANYLLVRAGAFFHDIGKMVKPKYYTENQVSLEDKKAHSRLSPYMSVLIIKNHVKEGIDLAQRYNLPQKIIDFIPEHHGTGLIRYFYTEALRRYEESEAVDPVREEDFRYPGPKPQSVETAIVMLADSVEAIAASRFTGGQVSEDELRQMVQTAISDRFNDGQFDQCDLTLRQLYDLREALVRTLMARYHFRIAYPTGPRREASAPVASIAIAGPRPAA